MKEADDEFILGLAGLPTDYPLAKGSPSVLRTDAEWIKMEDSGKVMEFNQPRSFAQKQANINDTVNVPSAGFNPRFLIELDLRKNLRE